VNRMTQQLSSLVGFSKGHDALRPAYGDVGEVIGHAIKSITARPEFRHVSITVSREGTGQAWFDNAKLERVFHNLLLNACEAVKPESGRIEVTTVATGEGLEVRVADNGRGIAAEIRDRIFQPFVSHGKENGFGLGLAAVQKIVQDHGGQVTVERSDPNGTIFLVRLPRTAPSDTVVVS